MSHCNFFWGGHGCDLTDDHRIHECGTTDPEGPCSQYDEDSGMARSMEYNVYTDGTPEVVGWSTWKYHGHGWRQ